MNFITRIIVCVLLLAVAGCSGNVGDSLDRAESSMVDNPALSLQILDSVKNVSKSGEDAARFALLYSQALDKNYIDVKNDSLICTAVDFYSGMANRKEEQFLAFYYWGRVQSNNDDYHNAIVSYTQAEMISDAISDNYLKGLLYSQMGSTYENNYIYTKSIEYYTKAAEQFLLANKSLHYSYAILDLSNVYRNIREYGKASVLLEDLIDKSENNRVLLKNIYGSLMVDYQRSGNEKLRNAYEKYRSVVGSTDFFSLSASCIAAEMFANMHKRDSAFYYLKHAWSKVKSSDDSVAVFFASNRTYFKLHMLMEAQSNLTQGLELQDKNGYEYVRTTCACCTEQLFEAENESI